MNEQDLFDKKEELERMKQSINRLEGQLESAEQQLATEFSCNTVAEARTKLKKMNAQVQQVQTDIKEKTDALLEKYPELEE